MSVVSRSRNPFRVLATHRNFRLFWTGQTLSLVGSWMQTMALGWLSLQLSNSAAVVGLVAGVGSLPVVLLSMHAGALVDRMDRLRVVRITQAVFLAQAVVLWAFVWTDHATIPLLLGLRLLGLLGLPAVWCVVVVWGVGCRVGRLGMVRSGGVLFFC